MPGMPPSTLRRMLRMRLLAAASASASGSAAKMPIASMRRSKSYSEAGFNSATALKCVAGTPLSA
ncbi:hypothetical protein D3C73_1640070 [compost metagenome]